GKEVSPRSERDSGRVPPTPPPHPAPLGGKANREPGPGNHVRAPPEVHSLGSGRRLLAVAWAGRPRRSENLKTPSSSSLHGFFLPLFHRDLFLPLETSLLWLPLPILHLPRRIFHSFLTDCGFFFFFCLFVCLFFLVFLSLLVNLAAREQPDCLTKIERITFYPTHGCTSLAKEIFAIGTNATLTLQCPGYSGMQTYNTQAKKKRKKREVTTYKCREQVAYLMGLWRRFSRIS
uniref:Thymic stromal lymphopoietin n=1 Tax=Mustela putorius furo TaxID=9669 RepID=M3YMJ4_MUSPF